MTDLDLVLAAIQDTADNLNRSGDLHSMCIADAFEDLHRNLSRRIDSDADRLAEQLASRLACTHGDGCPVHPEVRQPHNFDGDPR